MNPSQPDPPALLGRRSFLIAGGIAAATVLSGAGCASHGAGGRRRGTRLLFTSKGRTGIIFPDGTGLGYLDPQVPDQVTWQPGPALSDGRRIILLSMEARRDGPGRPFDKYYHKTPTHIWIHDLVQGDLTEIVTRNRLAPFQTPALLVSDERILVQVVRDEGGQIISMNLDGSDPKEFTRIGEGLPYGLSLSPDCRRVAYHLASPEGYQVWTCDIDGTNRVKVAAHPDRLYFGPTWSPDGVWLAFQSCEFKADPGHDWADVYLARPDGTGLKAVTRGQRMWFGATYGNPANRGGGSNIPAWTRSGRILAPLRSEGARVPWRYRTDQPDTDHFNRTFEPGQASGGVAIAELDPHSGDVRYLTPPETGVWDFRSTESSDGRHVAYCRARTGGVPELRIIDRKDMADRLLTRGIDDAGADHPRWLG